MVTGFSIPHLHMAAFAALSAQNCSVAGDTFECRLLSLLHVLYVLGAVLIVILAVVVIFAIRAWYSGRNSDDIPQPRPKQVRHHD